MEIKKNEIDNLELLANQGDKNAQTKLGICYYHGDGIPKNLEKAIEWLKKAAEIGSKKSAKWLEKIAEEGNKEVTIYLARCYSAYDQHPLNLGYDNKNKLTYWLLKAGNLGEAWAYRYLARAYFWGFDEFKKNVYEFVYWLEKAAELGDKADKFDVGICYLCGFVFNEEFDRDYFETLNKNFKEKTLILWEEAANLGYEYAQYNLGICYKNAFGVEQDYNKSFYWWEKAAKQNLTEAKIALGICYDKGYGVTKDTEKAIEWFKKITDKDNNWEDIKNKNSWDELTYFTIIDSYGFYNFDENIDFITNSKFKSLNDFIAEISKHSVIYSNAIKPEEPYIFGEESELDLLI